MSLPPRASHYTWTQKPIRIDGGVEQHMRDGRSLVSATRIRPDQWGYLDHLVIRWPGVNGRPNMDASSPFELWIASADDLLVFPVVRDVLPPFDPISGKPNT